MMSHAQTPTKTQVETTIAADIPDNTIGFVTPAKLRNVATSILNYAATKPPITHSHTSGDISDWVSAYNTQGDARYIRLNGSSSLSGDFVPTTTNTSNFGSNANRFLGVYSNNLYASGKAFVGPITSSAYTGLTVDVGLTSFLCGTTTVNGALLPNVSNLNIGGTSSGQHWNLFYVRSIVSESSILTMQGGASRIALDNNASSTAPKIQIGFNNVSSSTNLAKVGYATLISNNSNQYGWDVAPNINQSGTASYTVSRISPRIIASVGTTNKLFSVGINDADYGTGTHTEVFGVDASGNTYTAGNALFGTNINAGFKLDVNGTARATQYNVGTTSTNFIAGGGLGEIGMYNANCDLRVGGIYPAIYAFSDNTKDIGTSDRRWRNGYFGTGITVGGTSAPTHAVTLPVSSTGIALHNQSDQTTNFEVGRLYWTSNKLRLSAEAAGTGTVRGLLFTSSLMEFQVGGSIWASIGGNGSIGGVVNIGSGATTGLAGASRLGVNPTLNASSGLQYLISETPTINQSGSAGYVGYYASIYEQALGSGSKLLMDLGTNSAANGGGTHTSRASIDNTGLGYLANGLLINKTITSGERLQVEGSSRLNGNTYIGGTLTLGVSGDLYLDGDKGFSRYVNDLILRPYGSGTVGRIIMQSNDYTRTYFHATANGINLGADADVHPSAAFQVTSTTKGMLPPKLTASEASAIASPAEGLMLYVTNTNGTFTSKGWWGFNGATWEKLNN